MEMLLFENGSEDIYDFTNYELATARIDLQLVWANVLDYRGYVKNLQIGIEEILKKHQLDHFKVEIVGLLAIFGETIFKLLLDTAQSYLLALILVGFIMYLLMNNLRHGLIAFIPNIIPSV